MQFRVPWPLVRRGGLISLSRECAGMTEGGDTGLQRESALSGHTVAQDGRQTRYWIDDPADGETVVLFVHGSGLRHEMWAEQTGQEDWTAVTLDLSGHGESDAVDTDPGPETMAAYVADVEAVAREVEADVLVGHSLGGAIVQTMLLDGSYRPDAAVLADTGAKLGISEEFGSLLGDDVEPVLEFLRAGNVLFHDSEHPRHEPTLDLMREEGAETLERDLDTCDVFDVRDRLGEISVPTLYIVGSEDPMTPPRFAAYLAEHIPDGEAVEVPDGAHNAMAENPEAFNGALASFLAELRT
jgi:pimeloyl-ACP methyl ester carboxylesterase